MSADLEPDVYCPRCGYDLRGLPAVRCPECGFRYDRRGIESLELGWYDRELRWLKTGVFSQVIASGVVFFFHVMKMELFGIYSFPLVEGATTAVVWLILASFFMRTLGDSDSKWQFRDAVKACCLSLGLILLVLVLRHVGARAPIVWPLAVIPGMLIGLHALREVHKGHQLANTTDPSIRRTLRQWILYNGLMCAVSACIFLLACMA